MTKLLKKSTKTSSSTLNSDKRQQIQELIKSCNRALGVNGKVTLGKDNTPLVRVATDLLSLDYLLGCGKEGSGVPMGRYLELFGADSGGKTLLSLLIMRAFQREGHAVLVASREEFDLPWAAAQGVNVNDLTFVDTAHGDKALEVATTMIESGAIGLFVCDSIQAFDTHREAEGSIEDEAYGNAGAPQMWGRVMRRAYAMANQGNLATYLGISQVRSKIGGFSKGAPPDPEPTNIRSIKHWKSISVQTKAGEAVYQETATGKKMILSRKFSLNCKKNKTAMAYRTATYDYVFRAHDDKAVGFDLAEDAFRMARIYEVLENKGAHYYHAGKKIEQGEANVVKLIRADEKLMQRIRGEVRERMRDEK